MIYSICKEKEKETPKTRKVSSSMEDGKKVTVNFGGIGTLLAIIFMVLKLTGHIDWSWVWVFAPIWIPLAIALGILAIYGIIVLIIAIIAAIRG